MPCMIDTPDGPVSVFARWAAAGHLDVLVRSETEADWLADAEAFGLLIRETDPETGADHLRPARGLSIDVIGPAVITPAVLDPATDSVVTPAVLDPRWHVNMRLSPKIMGDVDPQTGVSIWVMRMLAWMGGTAATNVNKAEDALIYSKTELIDPDSVVSPQRVWVGS